jgi:hypothetical protein
MKTKEEIDSLKQNWLGDPCWDIETTEGFEEYYYELKCFRLEEEEKRMDAYDKRETKRAQTVCIRYDLYRYKGKLATVIETGYCEYDDNGKHYRDKDLDCAKLKFKDGAVAWNFTPNEYHILNAT